MMEHAKAIAGALTTLIVFVVAEIGLDLPDGVVAALGTVLTGLIVWRVTNLDRYRAALEEIADGPDRHNAVQSIKKAKRALGHDASPRGGDDMGWKV